jgi:hypothetical protein
MLLAKKVKTITVGYGCTQVCYQKLFQYIVVEIYHIYINFHIYELMSFFHCDNVQF